MARTWILMTKLFYLGLSILEISKIVMYGFLYCYMDTDSFIVCIKTEDIYIHIVKDVETKFNTSNYEWEWPFPKENKEVIGLMIDELGGKVMTAFAALRPKTQLFNRRQQWK